MRRNRNAKIVATLGPASSDKDTVRQLFLAGVDVFRLNFSHGSAADHRARFSVLRELEKESGRPIAIMADLQGPKIRVGTFADGPVQLAEGQAFRLDLDPAPGSAQRVSLPHREIFAAIEPKARLLLDDGKLVLRVVVHDSDRIVCRVEVGGLLSDSQGLNVPDVGVPVPALTAIDRSDLPVARQQGCGGTPRSIGRRPAGGEATPLTVRPPSIPDRIQQVWVTR